VIDQSSQAPEEVIKPMRLPPENVLDCWEALTSGVLECGSRISKSEVQEGFDFTNFNLLCTITLFSGVLVGSLCIEKVF